VPTQIRLAVCIAIITEIKSQGLKASQQTQLRAVLNVS
jgi:hypothetical protein